MSFLKRLLCPETGLFLFLWLGLMVGGRSRFFHDPGTFWHVSVGNRILSEGFFDSDPFSFTFQGQRWIPHQWLGETTMALLHRYIGYDGLLLLTCALLAGIFTWIGSRLIRQGLHPSVAIVLTAIAVAVSSNHFHVRPHLATIVGMAVLQMFLVDGDAKRFPLSRLAWLIPLFWFWSNTHGGALGGLATFALAIAGWFLFWRMGRPSPFDSWRDLGKVLLIWLGCAITPFLNPYFDRLPRCWLEIYQMPSLTTIIQEHAAPDWLDYTGWTIIAFGLIFVVLLAGVPWREWRFSWLLPLFWLMLACMRIRHAPLFAVTALVAIGNFFPATRYAERIIRKGSDLFMAPPQDAVWSTKDKLLAYLLPGLLMVVGLSLQLAQVKVPVLGRGWAQFDARIWPLEVFDQVKEYQSLRPEGTPIFNELGYGGFLIQNTPGYRVFIDDRCELYRDAFLIEFVETRAKLARDAFADPGEPFTAWQKRFGPFDVALVETEGGFNHALSQLPEWEQVATSPTATLYAKRTLKK